MGSASLLEEEPQKAVSAQGGDPLELLCDGRSAAIWRRLCPWLHVEDEGMRQLARAAVVPYAEGDPELAERVDTWSADLVNEGYFTVGAQEVPWAVDVEGVARGVEALVAAGLPPTCILMYDEPWVMMAQLRQLVQAATGGNEPIMDWAAFCVRAKPHSDAASSGSGAEPAGWPPHRDRGTDDAAARGFRANGSPRYTTFWLALTEATPQTSCLMVVPRHRDPGYSKGDGGASPLTSIFKTPEAFQHIRALPTSAGGVVAFSHRLLHWGTAADPRAARPRIAIAFAAADPAFAEPFFPRALLPLPALAVRLALVAGQALAYCANENLITSRDRAELLWELFKAEASTFDVGFRRIVAEHKAFLDQSFDAPQAVPAAEPPCRPEEAAAGGKDAEEVEEEGASIEELFAGIE